MTTAHVRAQHVAASPTVPANLVGTVAFRAQEDAAWLIADIRELDPREIWGRLHVLNGRNPVRLYALIVALAAMVPVDEPISRLLAWTDHLDREEAA